MNDKTEYIIQQQSHFSLNLRELWHYRELFFFFTWRDIKVKYKQTVLGFLWAILQPIAIMTIFVLFFSKALHLTTDAIPAPIFYFSALLFWNLFSTGINSAGNSMLDNAHIIKKIYFPRLIVPISSILVAAFDFLFAFLVFCLLILFYEFQDSAFYVNYGKLGLYFLAALAITLITTFGLASFLAALNVKYRDFRYAIPFLIQFLLFATPVIYPVSAFQELPYAKYLLALNPMSAAITLGRAAFTDFPVEWELVRISVGCMLLIFALGIYVFRKTEAYFADIA